MRLHVGTDSLRGDIAAYARRFDMLELLAEKGRLPKKARLGEMKRAVSESFLFSVRLPQAVSTLEWNAEAEAALGYALEVAGVLGAEILVLQTPPSVMPSARNRRRLVELRQRLPGERALAWEPRGLWEDEDAEAAAREIGAALVRDVSRELSPEGDTLYTRLRALGRSGVSLDALARTAEAALGAQLACVVIEGDGAATAATRLRKMVIEAAEAASFDDDDDAEDDDAEDDDAEDDDAGDDDAGDDDAGDDDDDTEDDDE